MMDLQNAKNYEDSLNNILHKAPLEAGVERVVITLLNDILSDSCKWPGLSAEDTPKLQIWQLEKYFGLKYSASPDGMILNNSGTWQQAKVGKAKLHPRALIETKILGIDPYRKGAVFEGKGRIDLLHMCEESEIDEISKFCAEHGNPHDPSKKNNMTYPDDMPDVNMPIGVSKIRVHWYDGKKNDLDPAYGDPNTDPAYDAGTEFTLTFKGGTKVKLYQSDWYLFDLLKTDVISVVLIDGEVARRFYKDKESGQIKPEDYDLTKKLEFDAFREAVQNDLAYSL